MFTINTTLSLDEIAVLRTFVADGVKSLEKQTTGRGAVLAQKQLAVANGLATQLEALQGELLQQFQPAPASAPVPPAVKAQRKTVAAPAAAS